MKKILSFSAILATVVLLGAGCNINGQITPVTSDNTSTTPPGENAVTETAGTQSENTQNTNSNNNTTTTNTATSITYTNPAHHFTLTLPATWTGYTVKTTENDEGGTSVWFGLPGWDDMFVVSVYPTELTIHPNTRYYGTDGQVYYYGSQSQYIKIDSLQPRWDEIGTILNSFTVANLTTPTAETTSPITYTNPEFHFTLTLPATWTGYTVKTTENDEGGTSVWFGFTGWDDILAVSVYPTKLSEHPNTRYYGTDGQV